MENLTRTFGRALPRRELVRIARATARSVGRSLIETMRVPAMTEKEILSVVDADSFEPVEKARARGKGFVILSAHIGAWEVLAAYLAARLGRPFRTVALRLRYGPYEEMLARVRRASGVETIYQDRGARPLLAVLRRNLPLGMLGDMGAARLNRVQVEFFGRRAYVPTGPAAVARASGAAIVPVFITWKGRRHHVHVLPEVDVERTRDKGADIARAAQACARAAESIVRLHPEQWGGWLYAWPTNPPAPPPELT